MKAIEKIVVPVDLMGGTEKLVSYAKYMAEKFNAVINFVYIVADYPGDAMVGSPFAQEYKDKVILVSQEKMEDLVQESQEKCPGCTGQVIYGDPVEEIVAFAKTNDADLIIIGTHGAKGLEKILLGSVAERVLKRAHCPVLVMNPFKWKGV